LSRGSKQIEEYYHNIGVLDSNGCNQEIEVKSVQKFLMKQRILLVNGKDEGSNVVAAVRR
jgi:hypothetical protein